MSGYRKFADRDGENSESTSHAAKAAKVAKERSGLPPKTLASLAALAGSGRQTRKLADDPGWWRDLFEERAAIRQHDGACSRAEAERLAWEELEHRWHRLFGERTFPELCAGCLQSLDRVQGLALDDGCVVHLACVARYGRRWRQAAATALSAIGLQPPA
jgi:hypothetical protein